mgnify:CR=1 FL=1
MVRDPVCGMEVDESTQWKAEHAGETYYFCCEHCLKEFEKNPSKFIGKKGCCS